MPRDVRLVPHHLHLLQLLSEKGHIDMDSLDLDLYSTEEEGFIVEELPDGNALNSFSTAATAGSASCPATSASSLTTSTTFSC